AGTAQDLIAASPAQAACPLTHVMLQRKMAAYDCFSFSAPPDFPPEQGRLHPPDRSAPARDLLPGSRLATRLFLLGASPLRPLSALLDPSRSSSAPASRLLGRSADDAGRRRSTASFHPPRAMTCAAPCPFFLLGTVSRAYVHVFCK